MVIFAKPRFYYFMSPQRLVVSVSCLSARDSLLGRLEIANRIPCRQAARRNGRNDVRDKKQADKELLRSSTILSDQPIRHMGGNRHKKSFCDHQLQHTRKEVYTMDVRTMRNEKLGARVVAALESRNMEAYYVQTKEEAVKKALELIPKGSSISMGGAASVKECGLYDAVSNGDYNFYDRDKVETPQEKEEIALKAFSADYFLGSVNAMSEDGVFINIDGNANRVAAYAYGPKHVLLIVGMNKVVKSEEDALHRARNEAAPINAQRFGIDTPCSKNGSCFDCKSPQCICCQILTTRFSRVKGRFQIILVNENLGF